MNDLTSRSERDGVGKEGKIVAAVMCKLCDLNPKCFFHDELAQLVEI